MILSLIIHLPDRNYWPTYETNRLVSVLDQEKINLQNRFFYRRVFDLDCINLILYQRIEYIVEKKYS